MSTRLLTALVLTIVTIVFGFPAAEYAVHGTNISFWPASVRHPDAWFVAMRDSFGLATLRAYYNLPLGQTEAFGALGFWVFASIFALPMLAWLAFASAAADDEPGDAKNSRLSVAVLAILFLILVGSSMFLAQRNGALALITFDQEVTLRFTTVNEIPITATFRPGQAAVVVSASTNTIRLRLWSKEFGYATADVNADWFTAHAYRYTRWRQPSSSSMSYRTECIDCLRA
ncbi:hypothetical protein [Bradyrhizobium liaoningense]|uniref:hypothetical protein n=1 Tax=Bradyrhizobium liaoningense TaxID=43992 RepID=UPI001BAD0F65|nr:hypothetical protein [Bradyrhizobium liaoningense]MBR1034620.1 hypothetical protein [Bradyrhizobium liaoningense]